MTTAGRRLRTSRRPAGGHTTVLPRLGCVLAAVALWQVATALGLASPTLLPAPLEVASALASEVVSAGFWQAIGDTAWSGLQGLGAACLIGVPAGLVAGLSGFVERSIRGVVDFGRAFPAIALTPVLLLVFGTDPITTSVVVFSACVFPLFIQTLYGARRIEPSIVETARSFQIPSRLHFLRIAIPSATPSIMTGLRLAATTAILVAVATEIVAGVPGIGRELTAAQQAGATATAYAYILVTGVLGLLVLRGAEGLESRFLRWRPSDGRS